MTAPGLARLAEALAPHGLTVVGAFAPGAEDRAPEGTGTLALVGADGERMWAVFSAAPEAADGAPDPLDRWSRRILSEIAAALGPEMAATPLFPFDGPPWHPFLAWAAKAEGARPSPVGMPATPARGLWASYRGALALAPRLPAPEPGPSPCPSCPAPCATACPVGALTPRGYDVAACAAHLAAPEGAACRAGCLVRLACPVGRPPPHPQRAFHMATFLSAHGPPPRRS